MISVLFVTNGHGEVAIARRIAAETRALANVATDHLALVGTGFGDHGFVDVGPQRAMPSGGLVAMGNVAGFARDLVAGFGPLWIAQRRFLRDAAERYAAVVAVGDTYALGMTRLSRRPAVFVGTAKSVYVAPYGPIERRLLRRAARIFVRDEATAAELRAHRVPAEAPGNVIVDLAVSEERFPWQGTIRIAVLPGSRLDAYANARRLAAVIARVAETRQIELAVSIAPGIGTTRMMDVFTGIENVSARPWDREIGAIFTGATLAFGQAGTANEAAAARGLPVVALPEAKAEDWYRMRQRRLLGDALRILPGEEHEAAGALGALLDDAGLRSAMGRIGLERMGGTGGAFAIARAVVSVAETAG